MESATHSELSDALSTLKLGLTASELHGALSGYLCAGGLARPNTWLSQLALQDIEEAVEDAPERVLFDRLFEDCSADIENPELAFDLLLPDDDAPMTERAGALVDWCRGFLGGMGLTGTDIKHALSGDASEILGDMARIAGTRFEDSSGGDEDEEAYAEVVEYVRIGVMLLHTELARPPHDATRH